MTSTTIFQGLVVLFVGILMAIVLNYAILIPIAEMQRGLTQGGVYNVDPEWDTRDDVDFLVTLAHLCVYGVPILSLIYLIACIVKSLQYTRQDEYNDGKW